MEELIAKYKSRISELQKKSDFYEKTGRGGMCVNIVGKIEAYNAVISDLKKILEL